MVTCSVLSGVRCGAASTSSSRAGDNSRAFSGLTLAALPGLAACIYHIVTYQQITHSWYYYINRYIHVTRAFPKG
jgi:hypothetical protein